MMTKEVENWGVLNGWRYPVVRITKTTQQMAWYLEGTDRERKVYRDKLIATLLTEDAAKNLSARMTSAAAERDRRTKAASRWFNEQEARLADAAREASKEPTA